MLQGTAGILVLIPAVERIWQNGSSLRHALRQLEACVVAFCHMCDCSQDSALEQVQ